MRSIKLAGINPGLCAVSFYLVISLIFLMISVTSFTSLKMRSIFNGKDLTGWDVYIGPLYDSIKGDFTAIR